MVNVLTVYRVFLETLWENIYNRVSQDRVSLKNSKKQLPFLLRRLAKEKKVDEVTYYLLRISSPEFPEYWLYVDISEDLALLNLDSFLRSTWLECCGHSSSFIVMEETYESQIDKLTNKHSRSMRIKLKELLLQKDINVGYTYDYGDSTLLDIKVVSSHRVITTKNSSKFIKISARNDDVDFRCLDCKKEKAAKICTICIYEKEGVRRQSWFCK